MELLAVANTSLHRLENVPVSDKFVGNKPLKSLSPFTAVALFGSFEIQVGNNYSFDIT